MSLTLFTSTSSATRNDFDGYVGSIWTPSVDVWALGLSRRKLTGNSASHICKVVNQSTGVDVPGVSANISMAVGSVDTDIISTLASAVKLLAGQPYIIGSHEVSGGDTWWGAYAATTDSHCTLSAAAFNQDSVGTWNSSTVGQTFGGVNLIFSLTDPSVSVAKNKSGLVVVRRKLSKPRRLIKHRS